MKNRSLLRLLFAGCLASVSATVWAADEKKEERVTFDQHIKPLFLQKCSACHKPDKKSGGLDLTNYTNLMQAGHRERFSSPATPTAAICSC